MFNKVILIGAIVTDIETRHTQSGTKITNFRLVTEQPVYKDGQAVKDDNGYTQQYKEFHQITVFNGLGETIAKHKTKGDKLACEGRIHYTKWTDQDGVERYGTEIIADQVKFI